MMHIIVLSSRPRIRKPTMQTQADATATVYTVYVCRNSLASHHCTAPARLNRPHSQFTASGYSTHPLVWGKLLALGEISGVYGLCPQRVQGHSPWSGLVWPGLGAKPPEAVSFFVSQFFWSTRRDQTLWPILTHDGSKCAESRKDVHI